mgnify:CR=1 FL=1
MPGVGVSEALRISAHLCITFASFGKCSQIQMPGTLVGMGLNSPRMLSGASGFKSHRSMWLGAPQLKIKMTDLALPLVAAAVRLMLVPAPASPIWRTSLSAPPS